MSELQRDTFIIGGAIWIWIWMILAAIVYKKKIVPWKRNHK